MVVTVPMVCRELREIWVLMVLRVIKELLESQVSLVKMFKHQRDKPENPELKVHRALTDSMEHQVHLDLMVWTVRTEAEENPVMLENLELLVTRVPQALNKDQ